MIFMGKLPAMGCLGFLILANTVFGAAGSGTTFPMVEISFRLPQNSLQPFAEEFWGWIEDASGSGTWVPAFYDGSKGLKLRHTPLACGKYHVGIFSQKKEGRKVQDVVDLQPAAFEVKGNPAGPGFVRINPEHPQTFLRGEGGTYFPVGMNIGWDMGKQGDVVAFLERLAAAGGNWTRIWMCHWDDKNLDWAQGRMVPPGEIDLKAAEKWDRIVAAADRLKVPFQMVLQHHGQYSTEVDANWQDNPWNKAKGGFLEKAADFFTDPRARLLTKRKYRYIVARYGYSPSVMAWELFNEVEFTADGKTPEGRRAILAWHEEMAAYIRSLDPNRHLITTSAPGLDDPVWNVTDFYQQHSYPPDPLAGAGGFGSDPLALGRPIFYGEIGSMAPGGQSQGDGGRVLKNILWGGIFSGAGATAQYWAWDQVDREQMYPLITAVSGFAKMAGLGSGFWHPLAASIATSGKADWVLGPGQRWASVVDPYLVLHRDGSRTPAGMGFSAMLRPRRGSGERVGTDSVTCEVEMAKPSRWEITVLEVSRDGARMEMEADGQLVAEKTWAPMEDAKKREGLPCVVGADLPAGTKKIRVKSTGADFLQIASMRLKDYVPELGVMAMTNDQNSALWIYRQPSPSNPLSRTEEFSAGTVQLGGLLPGTYRITWWDTLEAKVIKEDESSVENGNLELTTPPVHDDLALLLTRLSK